MSNLSLTMSIEFQVHWLWKGIQSGSHQKGSLEHSQHVAAALLLAMMSLITSPGLLAVSWMQSVAATPPVVLLHVLPLIYGLVLISFSRITKFRPYIAGLCCVVQLLLDANLLAMFSIISSSSPTLLAGGSNAGCKSLQSQWLAAIANSQFAWFGYCNILTGYTRCGAFSMLCKPILMAVLIFGSPTFSTDAWYLLLGVAPAVFGSIGMSIYVSLIRLRESEAQYKIALFSTQEQSQKHSSVVNHVVKNSLADTEAAISLLVEEDPDRYPASVFNRSEVALGSDTPSTAGPCGACQKGVPALRAPCLRPTAPVILRVRMGV